jgi:signal transduction histidine kinase
MPWIARRQSSRRHNAGSFIWTRREKNPKEVGPPKPEVTAKMTWTNWRSHISRQIICRKVWITVALFSMGFAFPNNSPGVTNEVLTSAAEVLSLSPARVDQRIPVSVTGVVTVAEPNWDGKFFVQDSTAGIFVINTNAPQPAVGDLVQVTGVSFRGGYAPCIDKPHWKKLGTAPLPEAKPVSMEQFMSGAEDGQRIELSAIVISAQRSQIVASRDRLDLKSGDGSFRAFLPFSTNVPPYSLVGATVRIRGTASTSFSRSLRYKLSVFVYLPRESDLIIDHSPNPKISQQPFTPLNSIARYHGNNSGDPRIRVKGIVTYQRPGEDIFLHDPTGGLRVECHETNVFTPGEVVEAIGFPATEGIFPVLEDATVTKTPESEKPVVPQTVSFQDFYKGLHDADLVSLQGVLLDRTLLPLSTTNRLTSGDEENILTLKSDRYFFSVETPVAGQFAGLTSIPLGSTLQVSGICLLEADEGGHIVGVQIVPLNASNLHILQRPDWWTPRRLLVALGVLLAILLAGTIWAVTILRKNALLNLSIAEKIKVQDELQKAHDQLETRVQERTREWKVEMSARKKTEIILSERTRLAQELHDTLLQGFTGIGLKMEAFCNNLPSHLVTSKEQIQKILKQSDEYLDEARRSIWQLRSSSLEATGNFPEALRKVSERALEGTDIRLQFMTIGDCCEPSHAVEDNLLRICEEAVTNAVEHGAPTEIEVTLERNSTELRLRVRDNGCGFDPNKPNGSKNGHFGLIGLHERAKIITGNLSLNSSPGKGTEVLVTIYWPPQS